MILITRGINQIQILVEIYSLLPITRTLATAVARTLRYNQLQNYLRHCTVFWHTWTVLDLMLVIPPPPFIKVTSNTRPYSKLGGTTLNGREEGSQYYISQTCNQQRFEARKVVFSWECLNIFATGCSSNQNRFSLDFLHTSVTLDNSITLDNSNPTLTRSNFCFPSDHFLTC